MIHCAKNLMRPIKNEEKDWVLRNQEDKYYMEAKTKMLGHDKADKFSLVQEPH